MEKVSCGTDSKGNVCTAYVLENKNGMKVEVLDYGATVRTIEVPDKDNNLVDVVLGYDTVEGYENGTVFLGAPVGRSANRIGDATLNIAGVEYPLVKNDGENNLHSGLDYYHTRMWEVKEAEGMKVVFALHSPDGDQGYPGNLDITLTYRLTEDNELRMEYHAIADQDTIFNMTNHSYFNLDGHASGTVLGQKIWLDSEAFTRANAHSIPTGEILEVVGTPMDFQMGRVIGADIDADYEALNFGAGYDHNWVLKNNGNYALIGKLTSETSGIQMEVYTDLPGVQIYTGNFIQNVTGKNGVIYNKRAGVCFETQFFPDAVHHEQFASPIIQAGKEFNTTTSYKFMV